MVFQDLQAKIKRRAFKHGVLLLRMRPIDEVKSFIQRVVDNYVSVDLVRIGGAGDGGYLVPNILQEVTHCFSPGVAYTAGFESELSTRFGIQSYMADASVLAPPFEDGNFHFSPKFIGNRTHGQYITVSDWLAQSLDGSEGNLILQMDIEGGEYEVLTFESMGTLGRFAVMVIEFHGLQSLFEENFLRMLASVFEKIYTRFSICHIHPNNCCGTAEFGDVEIPRVMEVTFIRNDLVPLCRLGSPVSLPHALDEKNVTQNADIALPGYWWRAANLNSD